MTTNEHFPVSASTHGVLQNILCTRLLIHIHTSVEAHGAATNSQLVSEGAIYFRVTTHYSES